MKVGIAADHGGFELKRFLVGRLKEAGYQVLDFGAESYDADDDYPDRIVPLARALAGGTVARGIAVCGSGVGASIVANKVAGVRAALIHETFSARQGVEDDDMNLMCLGGHVLGREMAWELTSAFLGARFKDAEKYRRRLAKVIRLEQS